MYALHVISISFISVIGVQLCLTLTVFLPQRHSLIKLNELRFGLDFYMYIYIYIFSASAISCFWRFLGRGLIIFDGRNLTGTKLVPVEIEFIPGFVSLSSPQYGHRAGNYFALTNP